MTHFENAHFLIIRLSSIGDVLHCTTVAHNLKRHFPDCKLTWLASPPASLLLEGNPDIDELLIWDRRPFDKLVLSHHFIDAKHELDKLKPIFSNRHFDIVLDTQCLLLTGIIAKMSHAPRRVGIRDRHEFNHLFMTDVAPDIHDIHKIRRYLSSLLPLGIKPPYDYSLQLNLPSWAEGYTSSFWESHGIDTSKKILIVNTRTSWPDKNWPSERFGYAIDMLPEDIQIVFSGAPGDQQYIDKAQNVMHRSSISIAGEPNLMQLAALFSKADCVLTGDTGPLYIACAVKTPTISIWGPTHPDIYGPLTGNNRFVLTTCECNSCCKTHCKKKTNECINAITVASVQHELRSFFQLN